MESFISQGVNIHLAIDALFGTVLSVSYSVWLILVASYYLIYFVLIQFSPTMRNLAEKLKTRFILGNGLAWGGIYFTGFSLSEIIPYLYPTELSTVSSSFFIPFLIGGMVILVTGVLLMLSSYLESRNLATKFKEQSPQSLN